MFVVLNQGTSAPALWRRAVANEPDSSWDVASWTPHAVIVHLGTNDLCCDHPVQDFTFEASYMGFLLEIKAARARAAAPAMYLLGCGPMGNSKGGCDHTGRCDFFPCDVVARVATVANASRDPKCSPKNARASIAFVHYCTL